MLARQAYLVEKLQSSDLGELKELKVVHSEINKWYNTENEKLNQS